jgi:hypothetical protein
MKFGASEVFAQGLVDMHTAKDNGLDHAELRTPENTSMTSFRQWCEEVLKRGVLSWLSFPYEWLSPEQQEPEELFGCSYFWAGSTK